MRAALFATLALISCSGKEEPEGPPGLEDNFGVEEVEGDEVCENLDTTYCMVPFPSDRYLVQSEDGPSLQLVPEAMPRGAQRQGVGVEAFNGRSGFGISSPVLFYLPGAAHTGTEGIFDPEPSMGPDARTVLVNAATGERIPHWLEADYLVEEPPWLFTLRPAVPLPRGTRVVVGIRGLTDEAGQVVETPEPFARLRDQEASETVGIHARRAHFEAEVFPVLEAAGFPRGELQLAWDFTVATDEEATRPLLTMRNRMLEAVGSQGPAYTWEAVEHVDDEHIAVIADGVAQIPSFVLPPDALGIRRLRLDGDGLPVADGYEEVAFRLQIPHSALEADGPVPILQYGHGFLGRRAEGNNRWLRSLADEHGFAVLAANMQGMDETVLATWLGAISADGGNLALLAENGLQGVTNHLALQRLARGALADDSELQLLDGGPVLDADTLWYYGNSQGGSVGTVIMGTSVDTTRGVLGVPGCCYPFLMHRSYVFDGYAALLKSLYTRHGDVSLLVGLLGTGWDSFDPLTFGIHITDDPLPETPSHQVLLHVAREDGQVLNEVSHVLGRAVGARLLAPSVRPIWGIDEVASPFEGLAAITEYDFGIEPTDPLLPRPPEPDSHGWLRRQEEGREQMMTFLRDGVFVHTCDGPCVFDGPP